ncbi:MAG: dihydrolipoyl dehydrogenase [Phycisphaerae bacterium]|nr:dihydrolipoyl dehydrogenase [Phycisphaerae bacterium]
MSEHYDIAVIGTGPGGYVAALKAAQLGARVAVFEKRHLGGCCLNEGCIPSKSLLSSAELLHQVQHAETWGIQVGGEIGHDWKKIQKYKDKVIRQLRAGIASLLKGRQVTLYQGHARLNGPGRIEVTSAEGETQAIAADDVILAPGSAPIRIPGWPDDPRLVCTSDESVHWDTLPRRLLIVGGGVIGCEFACMMQPFGVEVVIVEMLPTLLGGMDGDLGDALKTSLEQRGIVCHTDTKVEQLAVAGSSITAQLSGDRSLEMDRVLVAVGRRANTQDLGLDTAGIDLDPRGFIAVDDTLATSTPHHYCIGDANGRCLLAHAASAQGVAAVENAMGTAHPFTAPIPSAVYTFPEVAAVGLTEDECHQQDLPIAIGRFPLGHLGKAMATHHTEGFVKTIRHRETDELLGVHMIGHNATECIGAAGALLHQKVKMHDLAETVFAHPTISESIKEAAEDALGMGLHLPPRKIVRKVATATA